MLTFEMIQIKQLRVKEIADIISKEPFLCEFYIEEMERLSEDICDQRIKMHREMYDRQQTIEVGRKFKFEFTLSDN